MRILLILSFLYLVVSSAIGQVESSNSILFIDTIASNNLVKGIKSVESKNDGINVSTLVSGQSNYSNAIGTNNLSVSLPFSPSIIEGFIINFKVQNTNTDSISLSVNGSNSYSVIKNSGFPIDSAQFQPGQIVSVIFNGNKFVTLSKLYKPCKKGFVSVNDEFCIDSLPRNISSFFPAVQNCGNDDAMLCTWNQWYIACNDSLANGSSGYLTNFEWVNDAGNNGADAKVAGYNNDNAYLGYGCKKSYSLPTTFTSLNSATVTSGNTVNIRYRCCYRK